MWHLHHDGSILHLLVYTKASHGFQVVFGSSIFFYSFFPLLKFNFDYFSSLELAILKDFFK